MEKTRVKYRYLCIYLILFGIHLNQAGKTQNSPPELSISTYGTTALKMDKFTYSLFRGDTLISITQITNNTSFTKSHRVRQGKYNIQLFKNDTLYHTFSDINMDAGYKIYYRINLDQRTSSEIIENGIELPSEYISVTNSNVETDFGYYEMNYGQGFLENVEYPIKSYLRMAAGGNMLNPINKHFGIGSTFLYDVAWTKPKKDTVLISTIYAGKEKYFRFGFEYKLFLHITTFNQKAPSKNGFYIDLGAAYNFPFLFRHSVIYANHKDMIRRIHRLNDVSAFLRIGVGKIGAVVNYRFFDYIRSGYSQNPKISLGLFILFSGW